MNEERWLCKHGDVDITGCRISYYPMSDNFENIILNAVKKIDTSAVWSKTDLFSTVYRGEQANVIDACRALFIAAYQKDVHSVCELTLSKGCPGDVDKDVLRMKEVTCPNQDMTKDGDFLVQCKYSFYSFGIDSYMKEILEIVRLANKYNLNPQSDHYVTSIEGSANDLFAYFDEVLAYAHANLAHYVLEVTMSLNSPSLKGGNSHE